MGFLFKSGNLVITYEDRCQNLALVKEITDLKVRFPSFMDMFTLELSQYLVTRFPNYLIKFRSLKNKVIRKNWEYSSNDSLSDNYIHTSGITFTEQYYNLFLVEVWKSKQFIIGNESGGKPSYLGLKLIKYTDDYTFKFIESEDFYKSNEEKKNFEWWKT